MSFRFLTMGFGLVMAMASRPAMAHPHIFVDAELEVIFTAQGQPDALRISWVYDPLFSMLLLSDMGLDSDFDGVLHADEVAALDGFDMNWIDGYHGDTHVTQNGQGLPLDGPEQTTSGFQDGRLHSSHMRRLLTPPDPDQPWEVSVHDPSYYTRYTLSGPPVVTGSSDCTAQVIPPDMAQAEAALAAELDALAATDGDAEADFPAVGALFADRVRISCPAR